MIEKIFAELLKVLFISTVCKSLCLGVDVESKKGKAQQKVSKNQQSLRPKKSDFLSLCDLVVETIQVKVPKTKLNGSHVCPRH